MVRFTVQKLLVLSLLFGCFSLRAMEEEGNEQGEPKKGADIVSSKKRGPMVKILLQMSAQFKENEKTTTRADAEDDPTVIQTTNRKKGATAENATEKKKGTLEAVWQWVVAHHHNHDQFRAYEDDQFRGYEVCDCIIIAGCIGASYLYYV